MCVCLMAVPSWCVCTSFQRDVQGGSISHSSPLCVCVCVSVSLCVCVCVCVCVGVGAVLCVLGCFWWLCLCLCVCVCLCLCGCGCVCVWVRPRGEDLNNVTFGGLLRAERHAVLYVYFLVG